MAKAKNQKDEKYWLQVNLVRAVRVNFVYTLAFAASIIMYDAWKLIPAAGLRDRWTVATIMLVVTTIIWYMARQSGAKSMYYQWLVYGLILLDIYVAAFSVYVQRGMSSRAVALFAIPIVISMLLMTRSAVFATATLSTAAYSYAAIRYFADHPSEGYKIELYGDLVFYSASFYLLAALCWIFIRYKRS